MNFDSKTFENIELVKKNKLRMENIMLYSIPVIVGIAMIVMSKI